MRRAPPSLALLAGVLLAACDGSPDDDGAAVVPPVECTAASATASTSIHLAGMQFVPFCATVAVGDSLTFTNLDPILHTVTTEPGEPQPFDSGLLVPGQQFSYVFTAPGAVRVHDRLNPWMVGIVIVQ